MTLDVAICTFSPQGIERVAAMHLPQVAGVRYVVSWQQPGDALVPPTLLRDDVTIHCTDSIGLSKNRNHALEHCTADVVLIADDDLEYSSDGLNAVLATFKENQDVDVATFRYTGSSEADAKVYPPTVFNLRNTYRYYDVSSIEIAFRRDSVNHAGLRFNELAGLGAPYLSAGEESLFMHHCLKSGLKCVFFPKTIVTHRGLSTTITRAKNPGVIRAHGACLRVVRGSFTALTRLPLEALRTPGNKLKAFYHLSCGYIYSLRHRL